MTPPSDANEGDDTALTRRGYLAAGAGLAGTGLVGTAAGQAGTENGTATGTNGTSPAEGPEKNRYTRRVVIPEDERFEDYNQDLFLHVIKSTKVTLDRKEFNKCNFANWRPEDTTAYRTQLVDRVQQNPQPVETNAFANTDVNRDLQPGSLYIINNSKQCPGRYIGLEIEFLSGRVPADVAGEDPTATPTATDTSQPGFGALGALGVLGTLGAGALARAWRRD